MARRVPAIHAEKQREISGMGSRGSAWIANIGNISIFTD
jgi:DNA-binding CsgD family transcriptional regulator